MKLSEKQRWLEQVALLFTSFIWTTVILGMLVLFWAYQDIQGEWDRIIYSPSDVLAQPPPPPPELPLAFSTNVPAVENPTDTPTATLAPLPEPSATPSPTAIAPPAILPETFTSNEPAPISVVVHTLEDIEDLPEAKPAARILPTNTAAPTRSPIPEAQASPTPPPAAPQTKPALPTRLVIESIGVDSGVIPVGWKVVEQNGQQYSIWEVADYAVGWHQTSAPLGEAGNTVMTGHNNINGEVFRDLANVEVGDTIVAYNGNRKFEYVVELKTIVKEKGEPIEVRRRNAQWIAPTTDQRLTLVSCWPYTNNTHRVIVVAKPRYISN